MLTLTDYNRRDLNFNQAQIETVLPEHFLEQYPNLVTFIKKFYEYLEDPENKSNIQDIFYAKDAESTKEEFLNYLYYEKFNGLSSDFFDLPRLTLKLAPSFTAVKGTEISPLLFFRYIFGVNAEAFYPKTQIFTVGESQIGPDSLRFIQDSFFYQILSIQIKSPLSGSQWEEIYKRYNHTAGFALFSEVQFETIASNISANPIAAIADTTPSQITIETDINISQPIGSSSITGIDEPTSTRFYVDRGIDFYNDSIGDLDSSQIGEFNSIVDILDVNSPRFSSVDSDDRLSDSSLQTIDESEFKFSYDEIDSA